VNGLLKMFDDASYDWFPRARYSTRTLKRARAGFTPPTYFYLLSLKATQHRQ
jgi:hypothetical protein